MRIAIIESNCDGILKSELTEFMVIIFLKVIENAVLTSYQLNEWRSLVSFVKL